MNAAEPNQGPKGPLGKRLVRGILIALAGGLLLAWMLGVFHREPVHKGLPMSEWVYLACSGYDGMTNYQARLEVHSIGASAIPRITRELEVSEESLERKRWLWRFLPAVLEAHPVLRTAGEIRYGAVKTIALFGPEAKEAVPALHAMLLNSNVTCRVAVAEALWDIAHETNTVFRECTNAMASAQFVDALIGVNLLIRLHSAAAPAAPQLLAILQGTNAMIRPNAATALGAAGVQSPEIIAALMEGADQDGDPLLKGCCSLSLWRLDPANSERYGLTALRTLLMQWIPMRNGTPPSDPDFAALAKFLGLSPEKCMPLLQKLVGDESAGMRAEATLALTRLQASESKR